MTKIILQPCRDPLAYEHFQETVLKEVRLSRIRHFLTAEEQDKLARIYPGGSCRVWGVEPKTKEINVGKWARITPGDIVFFAKDRRIFHSGTVTLTVRNKEAAYELWKDSGGNPPSTWECMYFLTATNSMEISVEEFNAIKGNKLNANIQGFNVLYEDVSQFILEQLGIDEDGAAGEKSRAPVNERQAEERLRNLPRTDRIATVVARIEHYLLTSLLHGNRMENDCAICHKTYPLNLLVTAHIKRRANCSHEERRNRYIVMPLCKLGCDELFERGYISVVNGRVTAVRKQPQTEAVRQYVGQIQQNACSYYNDQTKVFFEWHHSYHKARYFFDYQ